MNDHTPDPFDQDFVEVKLSRMQQQFQDALNSKACTPTFLKTMEEDYRRLDQIVSLEKMDSLKNAKDFIVRQSQAIASNMQKMMEQMKVSFDRTQTEALLRARRGLIKIDGDLPYDVKGVTNKHLAKKLHVYGDVKKTYLKEAARTLEASKFLRSMVVPAMDRDISLAYDYAYKTTPSTVEQYHTFLLELIEIANRTKSCLDFFDTQTMFEQYPGGLCLFRSIKELPELKVHPTVKDAASIKLLKKIQGMNQAKAAINRRPALHAETARRDIVPLVNREEAETLLDTVNLLIEEGKTITELSKKLKRHFASSVALYVQTNEKDLDDPFEDEPEAYSVDSEDHARTLWVHAFYNHQLMQHDALLPAMSNILFSVARGYIDLVEESMRHYK